MNHLKTFENNATIIYTCNIFDDMNRTDDYAFYNELSRDNFIINYIHKEFKDDGMYEDVENIFDVDKLLDIYNTDGESKIYTYDCKLITDVNLKKSIELRKSAHNYNL